MNKFEKLTILPKASTRLWKSESNGQWSRPRPPKAVLNHSVDFMKTNAKSVLNLITVNSREATAAADAGDTKDQDGIKAASDTNPTKMPKRAKLSGKLDNKRPVKLYKTTNCSYLCSGANGSIVFDSNGIIELELDLLEIGNFLLMIIEYIRKRIIFIFDTNGIIVFDSNGIIELNSNGIIEFDSKGIVKIDLIFNTNGIIVPDSNSFAQYWDDEVDVQTNKINLHRCRNLEIELNRANKKPFNSYKKTCSSLSCQLKSLNIVRSIFHTKGSSARANKDLLKIKAYDGLMELLKCPDLSKWFRGIIQPTTSEVTSSSIIVGDCNSCAKLFSITIAYIYEFFVKTSCYFGLNEHKTSEVTSSSIIVNDCNSGLGNILIGNLVTFAVTLKPGDPVILTLSLSISVVGINLKILPRIVNTRILLGSINKLNRYNYGEYKGAPNIGQLIIIGIIAIIAVDTNDSFTASIGFKTIILASNDPDHLWSSCRNFYEVKYELHLYKDDKSRVKPIVWPGTHLVLTMNQMLTGPGKK